MPMSELTRASLAELRAKVGIFTGEKFRVEVWREGVADEPRFWEVPRPGRSGRRERVLADLEAYLLDRLTTWGVVVFFRPGFSVPVTSCDWPDPMDSLFREAAVIAWKKARDGPDASTLPRSVPGEESGEKPHSKYSSECLEAIVSVIDEAGHRLTGDVLVETFAGQWGGSTVRHTLAEAVKLGKLTNAQDVHGKGYGLKCWKPDDAA
jgi:hypothetical protein